MADATDFRNILTFQFECLLCIYVRKKYMYTKEMLEIVVQESWSKAECLRRLNLRPAGGNYKILDRKLKEFGFNMDHFTGQGYRKGCLIPVVREKTLMECLVENSKYQSYKLKIRLIQEGLKKHQCECCLQTTWKDVPIPLELDHINGNSSDNRLENLQIICPNCHALTSNYRGKNKNKSALAEIREVEYRKFRETPVEIRGNPEPSLQNYLLEGQETRHGKSKSSIIIRFCKSCKKEIHKKNKYCSKECYRNDTSENIPKVPEILSTFKIYKNFTQVGKHFNVSDNAVKKWIKKYGIEDMIKV
jgi:5-methylcytosine-specific restriction endonuclease McrA